jgi:RimJ/RimL family protein N-acetyltransferase
MPLLQTDRLLLRPWEPGDVEAYADLFADLLADAEGSRLPGGAPPSREDAWRHLALVVGHAGLRGFTLQAVVEKASGRVLGRCGLWQPEGWPGLELAWALRRSARGQGFATEAAKVWRDYAFAVLGAGELLSLVPPDATASARVARRVGHRLRGEVQVRGETLQRWAQRREDWQRK